ncbi:MAG: TIM barrel protein, partial [Clostridiales bacterium]|nr:TIM barrel protein [Clostridiales bacterium]
MRVAMNITTADEDLSRFAGPDDLRGYLDEHHLDGIEVMPLGDSLCWLPPERVLGMHLSYYPCWVDFWRGDEAGLIAEFGSLDAAAAHYGGADRRVLVDKFASQLVMAERIGARYAVFHVADVSTAESVRYRFGHTDEQVVASALELIDAFAGDWRGRCRLLVENLWWPGLTMARPEVTRALMDGIRTPGKGIMLDTGHLMHTNPALT